MFESAEYVIASVLPVESQTVRVHRSGPPLLETEGVNSLTVLVAVRGKVIVPSELTDPTAGAIQYGDVTAGGLAPLPGIVSELGEGPMFALLHPDKAHARSRSTSPIAAT